VSRRRDADRFDAGGSLPSIIAPAERNKAWYDNAWMCLKGHVINSMGAEHPERNKAYCPACGAKVIYACQKCATLIQGIYYQPGAITNLTYRPPMYCYNCGKAYPWTLAKIRAAKELTEITTDLTDEQRRELRSTINDIAKNTPRAQPAVERLKRLMSSASQGGVEVVKKVVIEVGTDWVKRQMGLPL
jgi:hypothetical protein